MADPTFDPDIAAAHAVILQLPAACRAMNDLIGAGQIRPNRLALDLRSRLVQHKLNPDRDLREPDTICEPLDAQLARAWVEEYYVDPYCVPGGWTETVRTREAEALALRMTNDPHG